MLPTRCKETANQSNTDLSAVTWRLFLGHGVLLTGASFRRWCRLLPVGGQHRAAAPAQAPHHRQERIHCEYALWYYSTAVASRAGGGGATGTVKKNPEKPTQYITVLKWL